MCTVEALSQASANLQRLQGEISENEKRIVNNERALSSISDLDVAAESTRLAVAKLKYESAARLLQNAQIVPQAILSLLTEENL
jgi:flagellin-like hook-associated protein FlgL